MSTIENEHELIKHNVGAPLMKKSLKSPTSYLVLAESYGASVVTGIVFGVI